jgi:hypothetical protein
MRSVWTTPRTLAAAIVPVMAFAVIVPIPGAAAAAPMQDGGSSLLGSTPLSARPGSGVTSKPLDPARAPTSQRRPAMLTLTVTDPAAAAKHRLPTEAAAKEAPFASYQPDEGDLYCEVSISTDTGPIVQDDFLEETVGMDYDASVYCNFYLTYILGQAGVFDRSVPFNGETFNNEVLDTGTITYNEGDNQGFSFGSMNVYARDYNGGRTVEAAYELYLQAPEGIIWAACNPIPGLRYLLCDGLDTSLLHIIMGTGPFGTGMTRACRDLTAPLDAEQQRLRVALPTTAAPASTLILRRIDAMVSQVVLFKRDLCSVTSAGAADTFAEQRGFNLWNTATFAARSGLAAGDDRPLYWARLSMTAAFSQWRPATIVVSLGALQDRLDRVSRGMTTVGFLGLPKRVLISGFDPFELDGTCVTAACIFNGNPSGAAALRLDGTSVGSTEFQAVIFPVRYGDFNAGRVEEIFQPYLLPGPQQATIVATVSQQGDQQFDLEVYNGRRRSSGLLDNRHVGPVDGFVADGLGTYSSPATPPVGPGKEFVTSTLPLQNMAVGGPYPVQIDTHVIEKFPNSPPSVRTNGPSKGSIAVEGGGGGFLSNEIAYRVTRLRTSLSSTVPAGHIHVPRTTTSAYANDNTVDDERNAIVGQLQSILLAATLTF